MWNKYTKASEEAGFSTEEYFGGKLTRSQRLLKEYTNSLEDATGSAEDFAEKSEEIAQSLTVKSIKELGIEAAITAATTLLFYGLDAIIETKAETKELANEIKETYKTANESIESNNQTINSLASDFERLSRGVDDYGNNISLTNEQYEQYKNLCQTIADINPSLIKAYDSEGKAIIEKNDAISKTIQLLKEQQRQENINYTNDKNLSTLTKDMVNDIDDLQNNLEDVEEFKIKDILGEADYDIVNKVRDAISENISNTNKMYNDGYSEQQIQAVETLNDYFTNKVTDPQLWQKAIDDLFNSGITSLLGPTREADKDDFEEFVRIMQDRFEQLAYVQNDIRRYYTSFSSMGTVYASTSDVFEKLNDEQKTIVNSMINMFDYEQMLKETDYDEDRFVYSLKRRVNKLIDAVQKDSGLSDLLSGLLKIDSSKINYEEYTEQVQEIINRISKTDFGKEYGVDEIKLALGFAIKTDDGQIEDDVSRIYNNVLERLNQKFNSTDTASLIEKGRIPSELSKLTVDKLRTLYNTDISSFGSLNEIWEYLNGKNSGFSISDYTEEIDKLQDTLKSLGDAISKLTTSSLNAQDTVDLLQTFPELSKYTDDIGKGLMEIAKSSPDELIAKLQSIKDSMAGDTSEIERVISLIKQMRDEALGLSKNGLIDYGKAKIQAVIDELEKANAELQKEKDTLDKISDKYSKAQNAVTNVLQEEINSLKDSQTTITDYYNNQINLLKEENDEREKNIELQEKQKALDDAKRNKVRVYSAARGWTIQSDTEAITTAQNNLDSTLNNNQIAELEEKRDKQSNTIQGQIDAIEKYLKLWEEATVNSASDLADRRAAEELLGEDWKTAITNGDLSIVNAFKNGYEANELKIDDTQTKIDNNTAKIDQCNTNIEQIGELLSNEETGLKSIFASIDPVNLNTENLGANLEKLYGWVTRMFGDPTLEGYENEQPEALAAKVESAYDWISRWVQNPQATQNELISKVLNTVPGTVPTENTVRKVSAISAEPVVRGDFSPTITNNFTANHIDNKLIAQWWDSMLESEYGKFLAGKR